LMVTGPCAALFIKGERHRNHEANVAQSGSASDL
jgi:hypothetical protein